MIRGLLVGLLVLVGAPSPAPGVGQVGELNGPAAAVAAFHAALTAGDREAALSWLAADLTVLEGGVLETRAEYEAGHLAADMEFSASVETERSSTRVTVDGDTAWTVATSTARGTFRGHEVASAGVELMVLTRTADGWRIRAIHWSAGRLAAD